MLAGGGAARRRRRLARDRRAARRARRVSINGKGTLAEDHPLALGAGLRRARSTRELATDSDAVLVVGSELAPSDLWLGPLPLAGKVVRIDVDPAQAVTNAVPGVAVIGDAALALAGLLDRLGDGAARPAASAPRAGARALRAEARGARRALVGALDAIAAALGRDGVLAGDSAMVCYYGAVAALPATRRARSCSRPATARSATRSRPRSARSSAARTRACSRCR